MRHLIFAIVFLKVFGLSSQCLVPNNNFKDFYISKDLLLAKNWTIKGKYVRIYNDSLPYPLNERDPAKKLVGAVKKLLFKNSSDYDKEILYIGYYIKPFGRKDNQTIYCKLTSPLQRDSLYEISMDFHAKTGYNGFEYKFYPVYLSANYNPSTPLTKLAECKLFKSDSSYINEKDHQVKIKCTYKANGGEQFFIISTNLDYDKTLNIIDLTKCKDNNKYGFSLYIDNICIRTKAK